MKIKFFFIIFLLLFSRGCDFYSTSLWFFDHPEGEQNLLYRFLGLGWQGLILSNMLIVGLVILSFYYYSYHYKIDSVTTRHSKLTNYISERYYGKSGLFFQVFYKIPTNKKTLLGHTGYVLIRVVIIGSFLATIHNLCQYYNVPIYNAYRELVIRPLFVVYGLIVVSFIYFQYRIWKKEFNDSQVHFDTHAS